MNRLNCEMLETRPLMDTKPVLLVIANQDFYYQEYNDTRNSLLSQNVPVVVAATTTAPSTPHPNSGQGSGSGVVTPNIALANVDADDYSAIAFVGGWGSSVYQYSFSGTTSFNGNKYSNALYNGDANLADGIIAPQKVIVNNLINEFIDDDKVVAGVCHGTMVLAWARVDGVSALHNRFAAVPLSQGTPAMTYDGAFYNAGYSKGQYDQALDNGAIVYPIVGQYGNPTTSTDDVIVDGKIITAENNFSAAQFGLKIAEAVKADPVLSVSVNDGAAQRSRVTSITVTFSAQVTFNPVPNAIRIVRTDGVEVLPTEQLYGNYNFNPDGTSSITVTFSATANSAAVQNGSLADGRYVLRIPSHNYTSPEFHRLFGDIDGNSSVDGAADFAAFGNEFGRTVANSPFDINRDGAIDGPTDFAAFGANFGRTLS